MSDPASAAAPRPSTASTLDAGASTAPPAAHHSAQPAPSSPSARRPAAQTGTGTGLRRSMEVRHLVMIALGGVIGSGLFLSSGYTIAQAGPLGAILAYLVGAAVAWMVMTCLGELAVAHPEPGGFHLWADRELGRAWGFTTAWLYWLCWAVAIGSEFTAAGALMQRWLPQVPVAAWCLVFTIVLFSLNALSARAFGESEFWFSLLKVAAVVLLIIAGAATVLGVNPLAEPASSGIGLQNLWTAQGLFPTGLSGVLVTVLAVFYSFSGTELIGIAAGETKDPSTAIPRAVRTAVLRLTIFFVGAIAVLALLIPFESAGVDESPFVTVLALSGIPYADDLMNLVVITALLSAGNSGLYSCTRLLHSLAAQGQAPAALALTTRRGVPLPALAVSMIGGLASLLSSVIAAGSLFLALVSIAGFAVVAVWIVIVAAQLAHRRRVRREGREDQLVYRSPAFPWLGRVTLVLLLASLVGVALDPAQRAALWFGVPFTAVCVAWCVAKEGTRALRPTAG